MTQIPTDEALRDAWEDAPPTLEESLRAVATRAAEQAVKEAVRDIFVNLPTMPQTTWREIRHTLRTRYPQVFETPIFNGGTIQHDGLVYGMNVTTPPKEQPVQSISEKIKRAQMAAQLEMGRGKRCGDDGPPLVPTKPSPDPATVRVCIEMLKAEGYDDEAATRCLESLLPTPAPGPERYVTVEEVADTMKDIGGTLVASRVAVLSRLDKLAAARGPMLTVEKAYATMAEYFCWNDKAVDAGWGAKALELLRAAAQEGK